MIKNTHHVCINIIILGYFMLDLSYDAGKFKTTTVSL